MSLRFRVGGSSFCDSLRGLGDQSGPCSCTCLKHHNQGLGFRVWGLGLGFRVETNNHKPQT